MQVSHGWTEYACIELVHWSRASQALSAASFSYQVKVVDVRPQLVLSVGPMPMGPKGLLQGADTGTISGWSSELLLQPKPSDMVLCPLNNFGYIFPDPHLYLIS